MRISMDGKGRFLPSHGLQATHCRAADNIFIERLWRTLKYECVYLHAWETGSEAKAAIRKRMAFYNHQRPHSALGGQPPAPVYWQRNDINQPDQQAQRVASVTPDPAQKMGSSSPLHVTAAAKATRYNRRVLLAPFWGDIFTQDTERKQTRAKAEATCAVMIETHAALGYEITVLPCTDIGKPR